MKPVATFSIVAHDAQAGDWGIAVASKFLAVGAVVPWARAGAGAVATQSYANTAYGPEGLDLMEGGLSAHEALERLTMADEGRDRRQVGLVDAEGTAATYTGAGCHAWAGGIAGAAYTAQGNILVDRETVEAMARVFEASHGELSDRLVAALAAGEAAGGDQRGRQSAAILVVRHQGGYAGFNDRYMDLRVDDDSRPIARLQDLVELHHLFFKPPEPGEMVRIAGDVARDVQQILRLSGVYDGPITGEYDDPTRAALAALIAKENFEERYNEAAGEISSQVIQVLARKFSP